MTAVQLAPPPTAPGSDSAPVGHDGGTGTGGDEGFLAALGDAIAGQTSPNDEQAAGPAGGELPQTPAADAGGQVTIAVAEGGTPPGPATASVIPQTAVTAAAGDAADGALAPPSAALIAGLATPAATSAGSGTATAAAVAAAATQAAPAVAGDVLAGTTSATPAAPGATGASPGAAPAGADAGATATRAAAQVSFTLTTLPAATAAAGDTPQVTASAVPAAVAADDAATAPATPGPAAPGAPAAPAATGTGVAPAATAASATAQAAADTASAAPAPAPIRAEPTGAPAAQAAPAGADDAQAPAPSAAPVATATAQAQRSDVPAAPHAALRTAAHELAQQVGNGVKMAIREGGRELVVRLKPAELGNLLIRVTVGDGGVLQAQILADRPEAARALAQALPALGQSLADMGLGLSDLDVALGGQPGRGDETAPDGGGPAQGAQARRSDGDGTTTAPVQVLVAPAAQDSGSVDILA